MRLSLPLRDISFARTPESRGPAVPAYRLCVIVTDDLFSGHGLAARFDDTSLDLRPCSAP
jgi:hypothetical protein